MKLYICEPKFLNSTASQSRTDTAVIKTFALKCTTHLEVRTLLSFYIIQYLLLLDKMFSDLPQELLLAILGYVSCTPTL